MTVKVVVQCANEKCDWVGNVAVEVDGELKRDDSCHSMVCGECNQETVFMVRYVPMAFNEKTGMAFLGRLDYVER